MIQYAVSAIYIETKPLLQIGPLKLFLHQTAHYIPDNRQQVFNAPSPDPDLRGAVAKGILRFSVTSYREITRYQIHGDNNRLVLPVVLPDRYGEKEHLIFRNNPDFVVIHLP